MIHASLPTSRTALSILASNRVCDGDDFRDDGYVYRNNQRVRKWFSNSIDSYSKYFWEPCLQNISHLESVVFRLGERRQKVWSRIEEHCRRIFREVTPVEVSSTKEWRVHAIPTHAYTTHRPQDLCWRFNVHNYPLGHPIGLSGIAFSWNWSEPPNDQSLHLQLGQELYLLYRYHNNSCGRYSYIRSFLFRAIQLDIARKHQLSQRDPRIFHYLINGRSYWIVESRNRWGAIEQEWMGAQGSPTVENIS